MNVRRSAAAALNLAGRWPRRNALPVHGGGVTPALAPPLRAPRSNHCIRVWRAMNLDLVHQAIAAGELPPEADADLLIDPLKGPLYFRRII